MAGPTWQIAGDSVYQKYLSIIFQLKNQRIELTHCSRSETVKETLLICLEQFWIIFFILCTHLASICFLLNVETFININA